MDIIEQIGAYAGFAAVVGLAVLSALYFSQARDVRRLRDWAGRAPERAAQADAEAQARIQAGRVTAQPQTQQQQAGPAAPAQQPAAGQPAAPGAARPATPAAGAKPAATATAAGAAKPGTNGASGPPPAKTPPIPPRVPSAAQQTSILPPSARGGPRAPWYRRIALPEPRYVALIAAGILVVGGGAAFGITQLGGDDGSSGTPAAELGGDGESGGGSPSRPAPVNPSTVTVSVLNGTTVTGLASQIADQLKAKGYQQGNITNALDQAKAESVVLFAEGARREARAVAGVLGISQIETIDSQTQSLGGNASVVVVVGADQTP